MGKKGKGKGKGKEPKGPKPKAEPAPSNDKKRSNPEDEDIDSTATKQRREEATVKDTGIAKMKREAALKKALEKRNRDLPKNAEKDDHQKVDHPAQPSKAALPEIESSPRPIYGLQGVKLIDDVALAVSGLSAQSLLNCGSRI